MVREPALQLLRPYHSRVRSAESRLLKIEGHRDRDARPQQPAHASTLAWLAQANATRRQQPAPPPLPDAVALAQWDGASIAPQRRFACYAGIVAATWDADRGPADDGPFQASMALLDLGPVLLWRYNGSARNLRRSPPRARADGQDHYLLVLADDHAITGRAAEEDVALAPGETGLFDMARPLSLTLPGGESIAACVKRDALDALLRHPVAKHGLKLDGLSIAMLRAQLLLLARGGERLSAAETCGIARAALYLLAASVGAVANRMQTGALPTHSALMQAIRQAVDDNLADTALSAERLCQMLGISRSALYRLMEPHGGVATYVQQRRLARVHALLADTQDRRQIAELAFAHGFSNDAHFSRIFRKRYGYAPRDVRNASHGGTAPPVAENQTEFTAVYEAWLRAT